MLNVMEFKAVKIKKKVENSPRYHGLSPFVSLLHSKRLPGRSTETADMREYESIQINLRSFKQFFASLPKTEIHLHLKGSQCRYRLALMKKNKLTSPV
jgi:hypothetical protein